MYDLINVSIDEFFGLLISERLEVVLYFLLDLIKVVEDRLEQDLDFIELVHSES